MFTDESQYFLTFLKFIVATLQLTVALYIVFNAFLGLLIVK